MKIGEIIILAENRRRIVYDANNRLINTSGNINMSYKFLVIKSSGLCGKSYY
jgi:hypothetical protein